MQWWCRTALWEMEVSYKYIMLWTSTRGKIPYSSRRAVIKSFHVHSFATLLGSKLVHQLMLPLKKLCLIANFLKTWPNLLTFAILGALRCTTLCSLSTAQSRNTSHIKECWQELSLLLWTTIQTLVGSRLLRGLANLATDHVTQREQNAGWWSQ